MDVTCYSTIMSITSYMYTNQVLWWWKMINIMPGVLCGCTKNNHNLRHCQWMWFSCYIFFCSQSKHSRSQLTRAPSEKLNVDSKLPSPKKSVRRPSRAKTTVGLNPKATRSPSHVQVSGVMNIMKMFVSTMTITCTWSSCNDPLSIWWLKLLWRLLVCNYAPYYHYIIIIQAGGLPLLIIF